MLKLDTMLRGSEILPILAVLALHHLFNPLNYTQQVPSRSHKVVLQYLVHPFDGRACDCVIVAVVRSPSSCPLGTGKVLVLLQVSAEFLLITVVLEQLVPLQLELEWSFSIDELLWSALSAIFFLSSPSKFSGHL